MSTAQKKRWATTQGRYERASSMEDAAPTMPEPPDMIHDWHLVGLTSFDWRDEVILVFAWEADAIEGVTVDTPMVRA